MGQASRGEKGGVVRRAPGTHTALGGRRPKMKRANLRKNAVSRDPLTCQKKKGAKTQCPKQKHAHVRVSGVLAQAGDLSKKTSVSLKKAVQLDTS